MCHYEHQQTKLRAVNCAFGALNKELALEALRNIAAHFSNSTADAVLVPSFYKNICNVYLQL